MPRVDADLLRTARARAVGAFAALVACLLCPVTASAATWVAGRDGADLQALIDRASAGDRIEVSGGVWRGTFRITQSITLEGRGAVLDGGGHGTVLTVAAPGAVVRGFEVRGSGSDLGGPDSCIYTTPEAVDVRIEANLLRDCAFGIWIHRSLRAQVLRNHIEGRLAAREVDRGNGIQLFDALHVRANGNYVRHARDGVYVSATHDSEISNNRMEALRYGIHYMYSYRNVIRGNEARRNILGIALMQSRELVVEHNVATDNERHGILFRDAQLCVIRGNRAERNGDGFFLYSSTENKIENNVLLDNEIGAKIWAGTVRNQVRLNVFKANRVQIMYVGTADLVWGTHKDGNFYGDYLGWDQNGDGIGDRPHRVNSFMVNLTYRYPGAGLLVRSPALELLAHLEDILPMLRVPTVVDRAPLMQPPPPLSAPDGSGPRARVGN